MATKDELQTAIDDLNGAIEELAATITTEANEIQAELKSIAGGDGVRGNAVDALAKLSARVGGLKDTVANLVTPGQAAPDGGGDGGGGGEEVVP